MSFREKYASQDQTSFFSQTTSIFENSCLGPLNWNIHHCEATQELEFYDYDKKLVAKWPDIEKLCYYQSKELVKMSRLIFEALCLTPIEKEKVGTCLQHLR